MLSNNKICKNASKQLKYNWNVIQIWYFDNVKLEFRTCVDINGGNQYEGMDEAGSHRAGCWDDDEWDIAWYRGKIKLGDQ